MANTKYVRGIPMRVDDERQITLTLEQSELDQVLTMLDFAQDNGYFHIANDVDEQKTLDTQSERFYKITGKFLDAENSANSSEVS